MPRAVIDTTAQHCDLKSCPDGYVELKRMPYGDWLHRADISLNMQMEMAQQRGRRNNKASMELKQQNKAVTTYEFAKCIVGHNLEDANGNLLDFHNPATLDFLDPQIGNEIGDLINKLHEPISGEEEGNF